MPKQVEIKIFPIAQTQVNPIEVEKWLTHIGVQDVDACIPPPDAISDPALLIALAAKRCYLSL